MADMHLSSLSQLVLEKKCRSETIAEVFSVQLSARLTTGQTIAAAQLRIG